MASVDLATANGHIDIECLLRPLVDLYSEDGIDALRPFVA